MDVAVEKRQQVLRIALLLLGLYALVSARLFHVQVTTASTFADRQESLNRRLRYKHGSTQFERGRRGRILDAEGRPLALGFDTYRLVADPNLPVHPRSRGADIGLGDRARIASDVLLDLGVDHDVRDFFRRSTQRRIPAKDGGEPVVVRHRRLLRGILPHERRYFRKIMGERGIRNFRLEAESRREYPEGALMAEVVGFVGLHENDEDGRARGRAGIEQTLEHLLAGSDGKFACEKDGRGRELDLEGRWTEPPVDGQDVGLTLSVRIQSVVTEALSEAFEKLPCDGMSAVVLETQTGRVLALKSLPCFSADDLKAGRIAPADAVCRPVAEVYPPGSTFKPFIMARAIEAGIVTWDDTFDTNQGARTFTWEGRRRLLHDSHPHGVLTAREVIVKSSNIGMAIVGLERMGPDLVYDAVESYRFRDRTGVLLPSESAGQYVARKDAKPLSTAVSLSFGHEISISPLSLAARFSIFGTGGVYHEPRIVEWIGKGGERQTNDRRSHQFLTKPIADEVGAVLAETVESGSGRALRGMKWTAGAKTGTAQIMGKSGFTGKYSSSLVALAPALESRITVLVGLHGLEGKEFYGGATAGPVVRRIIEETLDILGTPPNRE